MIVLSRVVSLFLLLMLVVMLHTELSISGDYCNGFSGLCGAVRRYLVTVSCYEGRGHRLLFIN